MSRLNLGARRPLSSSIIPVLLLALLPLVVMTATAPAALAATSGPTATATFGWDLPIPGRYADCSIGGYNYSDASQVDQHVVKITKGRCNIGWNQKTDGDLTLTATGTGCSLSTTIPIHDEVQFSGVLTGTVSDPAACNLTEVCFSYFGEGWGFDTHEDGCAPMALGPFVTTEKPAGCPSGVVVQKPTAQGAVYATSRTSGPLTYKSWAQRWRSAVTVPAGGTAQTYTVVYYIDPAHTQSAITTVADSNGNTHAAAGGFQITAQPGTTTERFDNLWLANETNSGTAPVAGKVIGAEVFLGVGAGNFRQPANYSDGKVGITDASKCQFWWGPKIVDKADTITDEPVAPLDSTTPTDNVEPTVPDPSTPDRSGEDSCEFSFSNPGSWASAGLCALVQLFSVMLDLLGQLLDAVMGLVGALLDGLLDLFQAMFVPDGDKIEASMTRVRDAFEDTSPGKWTDSLGSFAPTASAGGCAGPSFTVKIYSINEQVQPFAACSGGMATAANLVKLLLGLGVSIAGGLACIRGITSGLGWNFSMGRGADT